MSERLIRMVRDYLLRAGDNSRAKLAIASGVSVSSIEKILGGYVPSAKNIRKLALACGLAEEDALALAKECPSEEAKETA